jgi:DNA-directed RNA polymerase subunit RPC12/RpoP
MESTSFVCDQCGKSYSRRDSLTRHMWTVHKVGHMDAYLCQQCGKQYNLHQHMESCHTKRNSNEFDQLKGRILLHNTIIDQKIEKLGEKIEKLREKIDKSIQT